jgi:hypothetical protein
MNKDFPCKYCDHFFTVHSFDADICFHCLESSKGKIIDGKYIWDHKFVVDNLKFLEQKYDQSILGPYKKLETKI